jgi:hypothetical protein
MNHLEQLALDAECAVYVMASPDAQQIELMSLKPVTASDAERESLRARWPGRDLRGVGVLGRLADSRVAVALRVPFDCTELTALLTAFTRYCEAHYGEPHCDDSVTWLEQLHRLPDTRIN